MHPITPARIFVKAGAAACLGLDNVRGGSFLCIAVGQILICVLLCSDSESVSLSVPFLPVCSSGHQLFALTVLGW